MTPEGWSTREAAHASGVYPSRDIALVEGEGARVRDDGGRTWVDCVAGHGAAVLGHAPPALASAVAGQARRLHVCPGSCANDVRARVLEALSEATGMPRLFLSNSGAEAMEAALKAARLATGRPGLVAAMRGFHGRTLGALSVSWRPEHREPFEPLLPDVTHVPFDDPDAAAEAVDGDTAAVVVEPVQGEGGVHPASEGYLRSLRDLCDERGALLVLDEVQTGFGRTGRWFAFERHGVRPDVLALAKGMAGGFPMGATALGPAVGELPAGSHGSTFGGGPLACAACLATLETLREKALPERADRLGRRALRRLRGALAGCRVVREVRGVGLMLAVELRVRAAPVLRELAEERGVLALSAGSTTVRLLPPLVIGRDELDFAVEQVTEAVRGLGGDGRRDGGGGRP